MVIIKKYDSGHTYVTYFLKPEQAIFTDIEEKSSKRLSVCLRNPGNRPKPGKPRLFSVLAKEASGEGKGDIIIGSITYNSVSENSEEQ